MTPKAAEVLSGSKVRLGGCGDAMVVGIKVKVQRKIRVFEILCQIIASPLPECIIGMDIMSDWRLLPLPNTVKQKACKPTLSFNLAC